MPLDRFILILLAVIAAAGITICIATILMASAVTEAAWLLLLPAALVCYVGWRIIAERLSNKEDAHYDRIEK